MIITLLDNRDIDLREIEKYEFKITDLFRPMSFLNRYGGHTFRPLSVLEHTYKLSLAPAVQDANLERAALAHDCSEGLMVDLPRPIKNELPDYVTLEERIQRHLFNQWGIPWSEMEELAQFDSRICQDETTQLRPNHGGYGMEPLGVSFDLHSNVPWYAWLDLATLRAKEYDLT